MAEKERGKVEAKQMSNDRPSQIGEILSEEGKSAYVRLCCIELCSLYPEKREREFVKNYIQQLMKYLDLSRQAKLSITGLLLCALEQNEVDIESDPSNNKAFLIDKLKAECGQHQKLVIIPKDLLSFSLESEKYDARYRVLIYSVADKLDISSDIVADLEDELVSHLKSCKKDERSEEEKQQRKKKEASRKFKKGLCIGLGALGGGVLIGLTGGLAAPAIAGAAGTLFGGSIAVALASAKGMAILASLFGAAGAGLTGQKFSRRLGNIEQFEFVKLTKGDHLNVVIAVSGWLKEDQDENEFDQGGFRDPWNKMKIGREQYCLKWESKYLTKLGCSISSFLTSSALGVAAEEALKHTILQGLMSAVAWPLTVVKFGYIIDNPWNVCATRAVEVGKYLANILMERRHGNRPVTLVGFSFGARVIFNCLKALSTMKGSEGIVQEAILIGAPVTGVPNEWQCFDKVVAGRVVNGYYKKDWLLLFVYRTASVQLNVAGLRPVLWKNRRMFNVNLNQLVHRHTDYCDPDIIKDILDAVTTGGVCPLDIDLDSNNDHGGEDSGISSLPEEAVATSTIQCEPEAPQEPGAEGSSVVEQEQNLEQEVSEDQSLGQQGVSTAEYEPVTNKDPGTTTVEEKLVNQQLGIKNGGESMLVCNGQSDVRNGKHGAGSNGQPGTDLIEESELGEDNQLGDRERVEITNCLTLKYKR